MRDMTFEGEPIDENMHRIKSDASESRNSGMNNKDVSESMDFEEMESVMWRKVVIF
jgi:hypothetical protein